MSAGVNKVILVGNLGRDPELRNTDSGTAVCEFSLAASESWKGKDGELQERTEWVKIVVWGKQGENCSEYLAKGRQVYVEGRLQTRSWEDKDGNKRWTTEVIAKDVKFLGSKQDGQHSSGGGNNDAPPPSDFGGGGAPSGADDDIPF